LLQEVRGAFNLAAEPVVDADALARLLRARRVPVPSRAARVVLDAAWRAHAVPASPWLLDLALSLPVMDTSRAANELGWRPRVGALDAIAEMLRGMRAHGGPTPPLRPGRMSPKRSDELVESGTRRAPGDTAT
jgi:nucleoside-diphosphate-sugar epimerase